MRELERDKMKHRPEAEDDITQFKGFGQGSDEVGEADVQFWDFIEWTLAEHSGDEK